MACIVRQSPHDASRWFFDFDAAAPGGGGGASVRIEVDQEAVSIDGVRKNLLAPPRSTGVLLAEGLIQAGMARPAMVHAYNVEATTRRRLQAGERGPGTRIGNMLLNLAASLGGTIARWEPIPDGSAWHLQVLIAYP